MCIRDRGTYDRSEADITKAAGGIVDDPQKAIRRALMVARSAKSYGGENSPSLISDWQWRDMPEVRREIGNLHEIPSHVVNFGRFMDETANKAGTKGLTARDLIKAFTITRASIQRGAVDADKVRAAGLNLDPSITGKVRPEGAFGEWLHTDMGQRFLNHAERGSVDPKSIQNAVQIMAPFGRHTTDIPDALMWAAKNLPGNEQLVSRLVASAQQNTSDPSEWREFIKGVRGIGPSNAGFVASLLGRGDQPTLDARQLVLHTGQPSKSAAPYLRRRQGQGADEAVDRLAARQREMNLSIPPELAPHYQHLAHHAVWDAVGGDETTHQDVINAMRHAASGGAIEESPLLSHPLVGVMQELGMPVTAPSRMGFNGGGTPFASIEQTGKQLGEKLLAAGQTPQQLTSLKKATPFSEMRATYLNKNTLQPHKVLNPEDLVREGAVIIPAVGDRSMAGKFLTHVGDIELTKPVDLQGGGEYMRSEFAPSVWASEQGVITRLGNKVANLSQEGRPVYMAHTAMGMGAADSSHMMSQALLRQIPKKKITKKAKKEFSDKIRKIEGLENFPGLDNIDEAEKHLMEKSMKHRKAFVEEMDKGSWLKSGFPDVSQTRFAVTEPRLMSANLGSAGFTMGRVSPTGEAILTPEKIHGSYSSQLKGEGYAGGMQSPIPMHKMWQDWAATQKPVTLNDPVKALYSLTRQVPGQVADQRWLDTLLEHVRKNPSSWGYSRGGLTKQDEDGIVDRALHLAAHLRKR